MATKPTTKPTTTTTDWQPPQTAADREAHRAALAALPRGTAVLIHRPGRPPALGWSWLEMYAACDGLIRGPEGETCTCLLWKIRPATEAA